MSALEAAAPEAALGLKAALKRCHWSPIDVVLMH